MIVPAAQENVTAEIKASSDLMDAVSGELCFNPSFKAITGICLQSQKAN